MLSLFFYKKLNWRSDLETEKARQVLTEGLNNFQRNRLKERMAMDGWLIHTELKDIDFQVRINQKTHFFNQRQYPNTILKGSISPVEKGTAVTSVITLSYKDLFLLFFLFLVLLASLFYGFRINNTELILIASALIFLTYILTLLSFNKLVNLYRQVVEEIFSDLKYQVYHLY